MNFIYCFDTNYNSQAFTSIISLLDCVDKKIDIFIIHNDKNFEKKIPKQINKHKNLNSLHIYIFKKQDITSQTYQTLMYLRQLTTDCF